MTYQDAVEAHALDAEVIVRHGDVLAPVLAQGERAVAGADAMVAGNLSDTTREVPIACAHLPAFEVVGEGAHAGREVDGGADWGQRWHGRGSWDSAQRFRRGGGASEQQQEQHG